MQQPTYCGIDVGLRTHKVCVLGPSQEVIAKFTIANDRHGFERLESSITRKTKICLEPTGVYCVNIFIYLKERSYDARFCGTLSSKHFREAIYAKKKHDNLDSQSLAKYRVVNEHLTFDTINFIETLRSEAEPSNLLQLRGLVDAYKNKSNELTRLKNQITMLIDLRFPESIQVFPAERNCRTILTLLQHSRKDILAGKVRVRKIEALIPLIKETIGQYDCKTEEYNRLLTSINDAQKELTDSRKKIHSVLKESGYESLLSYCGLSEINVANILCEIRSIKRFSRYNQDGNLNTKRSIRAFKNFLGMSVTSNQSGEHAGGHKLVKFASKRLRNLLFLLALTYISMQEEYRHRFNGDLNPYKFKDLYTKYCASKPKMVAVTKIMSKIAIDLFFVLSKLQAADSQTKPCTVPILSQSSPLQTPSEFCLSKNNTIALSSSFPD